MFEGQIQVSRTDGHRIGGYFLPEHAWFLASRSRQPLIGPCYFRDGVLAQIANEPAKQATSCFSLFKADFLSA